MSKLSDTEYELLNSNLNAAITIKKLKEELEILRKQRLDLIKTVDRLRSANCTPHVQSENEKLKKQILELIELIENFTESCDNLLTYSNEEYEWQVEQLIKKGREILK